MAPAGAHVWACAPAGDQGHLSTVNYLPYSAIDSIMPPAGCTMSIP